MIKKDEKELINKSMKLIKERKNNKKKDNKEFYMNNNSLVYSFLNFSI